MRNNKKEFIWVLLHTLALFDDALMPWCLMQALSFSWNDSWEMGSFVNVN